MPRMNVFKTDVVRHGVTQQPFTQECMPPVKYPTKTTELTPRGTHWGNLTIAGGSPGRSKIIPSSHSISDEGMDSFKHRIFPRDSIMLNKMRFSNPRETSLKYTQNNRNDTTRGLPKPEGRDQKYIPLWPFGTKSRILRGVFKQT